MTQNNYDVVIMQIVMGQVQELGPFQLLELLR